MLDMYLEFQFKYLVKVTNNSTAYSEGTVSMCVRAQFRCVCVHSFDVCACTVSMCVRAQFRCVCVHSFDVCACTVSMCVRAQFRCVCVHSFDVCACTVSMCVRAQFRCVCVHSFRHNDKYGLIPSAGACDTR